MPASRWTPSKTRRSAPSDGASPNPCAPAEPTSTRLSPLAPPSRVQQRLLVGGGRVAMVQSLQDLPRQPRHSPDHRLGMRVARVERLDPQAVIGLGDEFAIEWRPLEYALHELARYA